MFEFRITLDDANCVGESPNAITRTVAAGSWDAMLAVARLYGLGTSPYSHGWWWIHEPTEPWKWTFRIVDTAPFPPYTGPHRPLTFRSSPFAQPRSGCARNGESDLQSMAYFGGNNR